MHRSTYWSATIALTLSAVVAIDAPAQAPKDDLRMQSAAPFLYQGSTNVFRRFSVDAAVMYSFYRDVLGLEQLTTFAVGNGGVARFQAGGSELKLTGQVDGRSYVAGDVSDATGVRLLTLYFPNESELVERFERNGLAKPQFKPLAGSTESAALVQDPDGQWLELIIARDQEPEFYDQIGIGLTVSNVDASREFYGGFIGLEASTPVYDSRFETTTHSFRYGSTVINLRSFNKELPADTGSGGIQYVVTDVRAVDEIAKARGISIDQPLSGLPGFSLTTVWLEDQDGITNYFAETQQSAAAREP